MKSNAQADRWVEDVMTTLLFFQSREIEVRRQARLSPGAFKALSSMMSSDDLRTQIAFQTARIAGLLEVVCGVWASTHRASSWVRLSREQQWRQLATALFEEREPKSFFSEDATQLWIQNRWAGWRLLLKGQNAKRPFSFADVGWLLQKTFSAKRLTFKLSELLSFLPTPLRWRAIQHDSNPATVLATIRDLLIHAGVCEPDRVAPRLRLTSATLAWLGGKPTCVMSDKRHLILGLQRPYGRNVSHAVTGLTLTAKLSCDPGLQLMACEISTLVSVSPRVFQLDESRVLKKFCLGMNATDVLKIIERVSGKAVSRSVLLLLHRWQRKHQRVKLKRAMILETETPELMDELIRQRGIRVTTRRRLTPRHAIVRDDRLPHLLRRMKRKGISPVVDIFPQKLTGSSKHAEMRQIKPSLQKTKARSNTLSDLNDATKTFLLIAARIAQQLPDLARHAQIRATSFT
jgi:hypothetical protein